MRTIRLSAAGAMLLASAACADQLADRFRLSLDRVLRGGPPHFTADFVVADALPRHVRRFTEFSGDVSGRYVEALARAEGSDRQWPQLDDVLAAVAAAQKPAGFFGEAFPDGEIRGRPHMALLWGNGRMLTGLVEAHRRRRDAVSLAAARKLGDFIAAVAPRLDTDEVMQAFSGDQHAVGYICWTQIIEGLVGLHELTGDARYLDVARGMARRVRVHEGQHSHGLLTAARGMVMLAAAAGEREWLDRAARIWQEIIDTGNLLPHGCVPEALRPMILRDEGCSEADWLRLSLALWKATRETKYLDAAEHCWFNEFAMNQFSTGDFGHRTISADGMGGVVMRAPKGGATNQAFSAVSIAYGQARAWWCCTFHGLRAFPDVADSVFHADSGALFYALPLSGEGRADGFCVRAVSSLETDAVCRLEVIESDGAEHLLAIRAPPWADPPEIAIRPGDAAQGEGTWRTLHRVWTRGDVVTIRYPLRTRCVHPPGDTVRVGFQVGPWMLGVEPWGSPAFFDEPRATTRIQVDGVPAAPRLPPPPDTDRSAAGFAVPVAHRGLPFLPGGYPVQPQTAWLRPLAEQTGLRDETEWVFWFRPAATNAPAPRPQ